ncbi:G protein coupled receptor family protein [Penicillium hispanicum]|uniref:G protein coupled receptor family protein n=1 Tax=Penicillium hispanicum TaxID=1080232 RepID=UPI002541B6AE|nr:G protein coupled receptor family protein [Penicillium hispanicum]KAJ5594728.1 G protein coupled receptor family protein [Penicillium hispanicum]
MTGIPLTDNQHRAMVVTERVNSSVSIVCIVFVIVTYLFASGFDKPINRLIFFASWGNLGSNIAALISEAGPAAGQHSSLCQFQAFLVEMFLGVDCYWAFFMAVNVYLVFFRNYTVEQLRSLDVIYLILSFILSLVPSLAFVFISTSDRGHIYGNATIWCWITPQWDFMRIIFLYGIVWVALLFAFIIYAMTAKLIWDKREHLDGYLNPLNESPFVNTMTEVKITHEERPIVQDAGPHGILDLGTDQDLYAVQVEAHPQKLQPQSHMPDALRVRSITRNAAEQAQNQEAWLYARVAFLFFLVLMITWIPTSVNRVYAIVDPAGMNFPLNYVAAFVFPLQAFWNTVIYVITSQAACRKLCARLFVKPFRQTKRQSTFSVGNHDNRNVYPSRRKQRLRSFSSCSGQGGQGLELHHVPKQ